MIDSLPSELYINIYKYISFFDMISLSLVNNKLSNKLKNVSHYIVTYELYKFDNKISKRKINNDINTALTLIYANIRKEVKRIYYIPEYLYRQNSDNIEKSITLYIKENMNAINVSKHDLTNGLYKKILKYHMKNHTYNNFDKYLLYLFYMLFVIDIKKNTYNVNYNIYFLDSILVNKDTYKIINPIAEEYFTYVIRQNIDINIDSKYIISKYITTIPMLRRLMCQKRKLNLQNSKILECCKTCLHYNIREMTIMKYAMSSNPIVSYNYNNIKTFFAKNDVKLLEKLHTLELKKINEHISFRNPFTNKRMYLTSRYTKHFLYSLKYESLSNLQIYYKLDNYITSEQQRLFRKYFA
jgi:hypothetical protein